MIGSMAPRSRAQDVDRHVGARLRERRIMLGLTQQQLAELIEVTYQQAHKYEKGINRIAAGRLSSIAQALGVPVGYFFDGLTTTPGAVKVSPQQRLMLELARNFMAIADRRQQEAICTSPDPWPTMIWATIATRQRRTRPPPPDQPRCSVSCDPRPSSSSQVPIGG